MGRPEGMDDEEWLEIDDAVASMIRLTDGLLAEIEDETSAKGIWEKLIALYQGKTITNKLFLKRKLLTFRMNENTSMNDHIQSFNNLCQEFASVDGKVSDEDKAVLLLCMIICSLHSCMGNLVSTLKI